jgi:OmpA-OmpF porin, OOP family
VRKIVSATALATVLTLGLTLSGVAWAQSTPSVEDTINALKPRPGKSRGSRPVVAPPGSEASAPAAAPTTPVVAATPAVQHPTAQPTARPPAVAAVTPTKPTVTDAAEAPGIDFNVLFASGSAELAPSALKTLDTIGRALSSNELAGSRFRIEGHTDTVGTRDGNRSLSGRRAAAVVDYLSQKFGIDRARLESKGMGQDALIVPTGDQVDEPRNRRVRIVNITG